MESGTALRVTSPTRIVSSILGFDDERETLVRETYHHGGKAEEDSRCGEL